MFKINGLGVTKAFRSILNSLSKTKLTQVSLPSDGGNIMDDSFRAKLSNNTITSIGNITAASPFFTITDEDIIGDSFGVSTNTTTPTSHITSSGNITSTPFMGGVSAANTMGVAVNAVWSSSYNLSNTTVIGSAGPGNFYSNGPYGQLVSLRDSPPQSFCFSVEADFVGYLHAAADMLNVDFYGNVENSNPHLTEWGFPKETKKQYKYSANVMRLNENEDRLLEGRFSNYVSRPPSDHSISYWTVISDITEIVEWIHHNITSKWSISEIKTNHASFQFVFVIEDKIEATHFHLRWSV